jgi:hypothetical protein
MSDSDDNLWGSFNEELPFRTPIAAGPSHLPR